MVRIGRFQYTAVLWNLIGYSYFRVQELNETGEYVQGCPLAGRRLVRLRAFKRNEFTVPFCLPGDATKAIIIHWQITLCHTNVPSRTKLRLIETTIMMASPSPPDHAGVSGGRTTNFFALTPLSSNIFNPSAIPRKPPGNTWTGLGYKSSATRVNQGRLAHVV